MTIRPTQEGVYGQVRQGLLRGQLELLRAQLQVTTGKRLDKPSDAPIAAAKVLDLVQRLDGGARFGEAARVGRVRVDEAAAKLQHVSGILGEVRELLLQGMNGTSNGGDREVLAEQVRQIRTQALALANERGLDGSLFAGTATDATSFVTQTVHGRESVTYEGNGDALEVRVDDDLLIETSVTGDDVFAGIERSGTQYGGFTGVGAGQSGDVGQGRAYLALRQDGTSGALGAGLALVAGGAQDTILGAHTVEVDASAGTLRLDNGATVPLPQPGDPDHADFTVVNEHGAELHLDFTGFTGASFTGTVDGAGSISLDGTSWATLDFVDTNLQLDDPATGVTLFVDTTGIHRAGSELVVFGGAVNLFDTLQGIVDDLENADGLPTDALFDRLSLWLGELDRNHDNVVGGMSRLGGRSRHLTAVENGLADEALDLDGRRSTLEDADFSQAVLDMTRAEQTLQLAQATGVRLLSTSLLDFLR